MATIDQRTLLLRARSPHHPVKRIPTSSPLQSPRRPIVHQRPKAKELAAKDRTCRRQVVSEASLATQYGFSSVPESSSAAVESLPTVSVVLPVHNAVLNVALAVERVGDALARAGWPHEIICVDHGSSDGNLRHVGSS